MSRSMRINIGGMKRGDLMWRSHVVVGQWLALVVAATAVISIRLEASADELGPANSAKSPGRLQEISRVFHVTDYGAVGDGTTRNGAAFDAAIAACASAGGGRVLVPPGTFVTGPIQLRSNVDFHLAEGAVIRFSRNFADYPLIRGDFEGRVETVCRSPLWGTDLHDVSITGSGTIDGQGDAWRPVKREKLTKE